MRNQTGITNCNDFNRDRILRIAFKVMHDSSNYNLMSQLEVLKIHRNVVGQHQKSLH